MSTPRGAGRSGGLLFLGMLAFVAYLAYQAVGQPWRWVISAALLAVIVGLGVNVLRRR